MAISHRSNPRASLRIEQLFGIPVLMSGLGGLIISTKEENLINQHHKLTISGLQRLHPKTPSTVIYFLAGSLPGTALLHLKQLSLFGMICRLRNSTLYKHAVNIFHSRTISQHSWFHQIREYCLMYKLPHPSVLITSPLPKAQFKKLIKSHVMDYWEQTLRTEAGPLTSLTFFKPSFMSLNRIHPIWSTAGSSPSKVIMATIQARMVSEYLCRHWSKNVHGVCLLSVSCKSTIEDLPHILLDCPALQPTRDKMVSFTMDFCRKNPHLCQLILQYLSPYHPLFCQFLLDCSVVPETILLTQIHGSETLNHLFHVTRTWCYTLHRERLKLLGRWNAV